MSEETTIGKIEQLTTKEFPDGGASYRLCQIGGDSKPEGVRSISLELLRKIWKDYVTPFVTVRRRGNLDARKLRFNSIVKVDEHEDIKFRSWNDDIPFPDFVDQWLERGAGEPLENGL